MAKRKRKRDTAQEQVEARLKADAQAQLEAQLKADAEASAEAHAESEARILVAHQLQQAAQMLAERAQVAKTMEQVRARQRHAELVSAVSEALEVSKAAGAKHPPRNQQSIENWLETFGLIHFPWDPEKYKKKTVWYGHLRDEAAKKGIKGEASTFGARVRDLSSD